MPVRSLWCKIINQCLYEKKKKEQKSGHNERILSLINNRKYFVGFNTLSPLSEMRPSFVPCEAHSMKLIIIMWNCETPIGIFDQPFKIGPPCKECPSYIVSLWMMLTHAIYFWKLKMSWFLYWDSWQHCHVRKSISGCANYTFLLDVYWSWRCCCCWYNFCICPWSIGAWHEHVYDVVFARKTMEEGEKKVQRHWESEFFSVKIL